MPRITSSFVCATLLCALAGCGDPQQAAGAIGAPAQKSNKAQKVTPAAPVEQKLAPVEQKLAPAEQKLAPADQKIAPVDHQAR